MVWGFRRQIMKVLRVVLDAMIVTVTCARLAVGQTLVVPETPFTPESGFAVSNESTALVDEDSVLIAADNGVIAFLVMNINTGATELPPTLLPAHAVQPSVALLAPDRVFISARIRELPGGRESGAFFVVNPLTGAIVHGPVPFSAFDTTTTFHAAVADSSTVLMAYPGQGGAGKFTVVDPVTGTIRFAETAFETEPIGSVDAVALDGHRVVVVYSLQESGLMRAAVIDPHSGWLLSGPRDLPQLGAATVESVLRLNGTGVLLGYSPWTFQDPDRDTHAFVTLDTATGFTGAPTKYASDFERFPSLMISPALLGTSAVFLPFADAQGQARFAVHALDGSVLVSATTFNPDFTGAASSTSSGCRVLVAYSDNDGFGKFQVFDFAEVCTAPSPCPAVVTDRVDVFRSQFVPFFSPYFQLQLVAIRNPTTKAITGPIAFAVNALHNGILFASTTTTCGSVAPVQFAVFHPGADEILSPGEVTGGYLLFLQLSSDPVSYTPRPLAGIPPY